uniref:Extended synaptotagmin-3 n=2 Tax=Xenopus tropicalis TaxID=8364 RepID=A0A6I8Q5Y6_XENTR
MELSELQIKKFALILLLGYFLRWVNIGIGYVIIGLVSIWLWARKKQNKERSQKSAQQEERKPDPLAASQVPFGDIEMLVRSDTEEKRKGALKKILAELWPYIAMYLKKLLKDRIEPQVRSKHSMLASFHFTLINFGNNAPEVTSVRTHKNPDKKQIILDIDISYHGDVKVEMALRKDKIKLGIDGVKLEGTLQIILEPLLDEIPFVGAVTVYFPRRPDLHINWTGLAQVLELQGLHTLSDKKIMDAIAKYIVLPNHMTIPLKAGINVEDLYYKVHRNVIRIFILEAKELIAQDFLTGKSDPYVVVHCGGRTEKTKVINRNLNPCWNEMFEMSFSDLPGQEIEFEIYDSDLEKDDFLGICQISLEEVMKEGSIDTWLPLKNVPSGKLHVRLDSLSLVSHPQQLELVNQSCSPPQSEAFSSAFLFVFIERAKGLQLKERDKNPSAKAEIKVCNSVQKTNICPNTKEPVWKETFTFFIKNPYKDTVELKVEDKHNGLMGSISVPVFALLTAENLTTDDWYRLSSSVGEPAVQMRLQLRILASPSAIPHLESPRTSSSTITPAARPKKKRRFRRLQCLNCGRWCI